MHVLFCEAGWHFNLIRTDEQGEGFGLDEPTALEMRPRPNPLLLSWFYKDSILITTRASQVISDILVKIGVFDILYFYGSWMKLFVNDSPLIVHFIRDQSRLRILDDQLWAGRTR
jgi:hypothetical protein